MYGLSLQTFTKNLYRVGAAYNTEPIFEVPNWTDKFASWSKEIEDRFGGSCDLSRIYTYFPFRMFSDFSFDELCKVRYSAPTMMDESVRELFETNPEYEMVCKIP